MIIDRNKGWMKPKGKLKRHLQGPSAPSIEGEQCPFASNLIGFHPSDLSCLSSVYMHIQNEISLPMCIKVDEQRQAYLSSSLSTTECASPASQDSKVPGMCFVNITTSRLLSPAGRCVLDSSHSQCITQTGLT